MPKHHFDVIVFPGGGNRCWWQAGLVSSLQKSDWVIPNSIVACSAGAAVAASLVTKTTEAALEACNELYRDNLRIIHWAFDKGLPRPNFAQSSIYPKWLRSFIGERELLALKQKDFKVSVARLDRSYGLNRTVFRALVRYLLSRELPKDRENSQRSPAIRGLFPELLDLSACSALSDTLDYSEATAAAAPFLPSKALDGTVYFDGGYLSSDPTDNQTSQLHGQKSLTLLTRHHKDRPAIVQTKGNIYIKPSQPIPVSTWGCTRTTDVSAAFILGQQDTEPIRPLI
jgi:predicted acylesterase/phospholipase RssA